MDVFYPKPDEQPPTHNFSESDLAPALKFGDWLVMLIVSFIPVVNLILLFIWGLDSKANPNRRNFARAMLVLVGLYVAMLVFYTGYVAGMFYQLGNMFENF